MASGAGSTFRAMLDAESDGRLLAHVVLLVVSRADAAVAAAGAQAGVATEIVDEKLIGPDAADARHVELFRAHGVDLVVLAGYLRMIGPATLEAYGGHIINTHPGPLPRFGGHGMYGRRVHEAVLASELTESAATVHLVDAEYDHGDVLASAPVPVRPRDDVNALGARVQAAERELLISTINQLAVTR